MKNVKLFSFLVVFLIEISVCSAQFRIIGYVHAWGDTPDLTKISFDKITHLNIAFVNPDSSGKLVAPSGFDTLVAASHRYPVKVLASIGGGSPHPEYMRLLSAPYRAGFIMNLVKFVSSHHLDGIDVDLEGDAIDKNYEPFVSELSAALKKQGKLMTAAVATWNGNTITDAALAKFDFINIMSYDQTGPWRPEKPGPHSTYAKAVEDLDYWTVTRSIPSSHVNLGLPFYGYCFGTVYGESMSFGDISIRFPGYNLKDSLNPSGGGAIYYNGLPTIQAKVSLARKRTGGVMVWQLFQDATGDSSLLNTIYKAVKP
ncbi:MAG TPA: glycosyl hydrolase family 18 protein [Chitinophagaceae bacterium]|nr:glycosyl hydrolase family 18 protein [Chitinophagaceae bacterium]